MSTEEEEGVIRGLGSVGVLREYERADHQLGNADLCSAFRGGIWDAEVLTGEFFPEFSIVDLIRLPRCQIYLRLMIER